MKILLNIARVFVGVLFIFSGLVKANDPLGLSYKMQEFFEVWGWHFFNDYTLAFSIAMIAFEIIAGVALLVGWQMRIFSWLLLLLIVFFTFLTGYAVLSGKVRECGCFGDCIPLTAEQSFMKDLLLLALIGFIFVFRNRIKPVVAARPSLLILFFTTVFSFALQWYVLQHLPIVDCLPYKVGNNIPAKMKIPPGAIPDSTVISFVYKKDGKEVEFTADAFPDDFDDSYEFVKRYDKVVREGNASPAIKDFALYTREENDTTKALLAEDKYQLFLFLKDGYNTGNWTKEMTAVMAAAQDKRINGYLVTNLQLDDLRRELPDMLNLLTPLRCDVVAIKTAARANPTLYLIKNGTILNKWGFADLQQAMKAINQATANPLMPENAPAADSIDSSANNE